MKLQRIYSSKLYVTSARKDKIHAAMQDPINAELVQQLSEYLDDEGQVELDQAIAEEQAEAQAEEQAKSAEVAPVTPGSGSASAPSHSGGSFGPSFSGNVLKDFGGEDSFDPTDAIADDIGEGGEPIPESDEPVEETAQISSTAIKAATAVIWTTLDDVISDCETIKGTLNVREETTGVNRLQVKDNELWIFYNDDANLNDKMIDVIEVLNAAGYTYLKFNRLARSNNAIVFDIGLTVDPIKPEKEIEEDAK